jgi:hypothetical protein
MINFQHDALACAIALGWKESVEISEVPLASHIEAGWLRQRVDGGGKLTKVVTRVDSVKFGELWLRTVTGEHAAESPPGT